MTFLATMGTIILISLGVAVRFFRKGGVYNPLEPHTSITFDETPRETPVKLPSTLETTATSSPQNAPVDARITPAAIYSVATGLMGKHLYDDLDPSVPAEVGCVQSVCVVLQNAGFKIPKGGLYRVNALIDWLLANGFKEVLVSEPGAVITAHRKDRNDPSYAHAGICGKEWIISNTSATGIFEPNYRYVSWDNYFEVMHNSVSRYFVPAV